MSAPSPDPSADEPYPADVRTRRSRLRESGALMVALLSVLAVWWWNREAAGPGSAATPPGAFRGHLGNGDSAAEVPGVSDRRDADPGSGDPCRPSRRGASVEVAGGPGVTARSETSEHGRSPGEPEQAGEAGTVSSPPPRRPAEAPVPVIVDWSRTSWQDPFTPFHWRSEGWRFGEGSMWSTGNGPARATFGRRYRKLTAACRLAAVGEPATVQMLLDAEETGARTICTFRPQGVVVSSRVGGRETVIDRREVELSLGEEDPCLLRLTATGNRVLVACDGRPILTCLQPAAQSGRRLTLTLAVPGSGFRIVSLRLEGE